MSSDTMQSQTQAISYAHSSAELLAVHFPSQVRFVLQLLRKAEHGALRLNFPDGQSTLFGDSSCQPVNLTLHNWELIHASLKSGDIGLAETYIDGHWHTDNLT